MRTTQRKKVRPVTADDLVDLGDVELPVEEARTFEAKIQQADQEVEEARVNFRWGPAQLRVVKQAAALAGIPYQTWMKTVLFQHAVEAINRAKRAGIH